MLDHVQNDENARLFIDELFSIAKNKNFQQYKIFKSECFIYLYGKISKYIAN